MTLLLSTAHMRAAAILGLGCSLKNLQPFQTGEAGKEKAIEWRIGLPSDADQADVILIFGGDGTIHRHLNQLVKLGLPVLVVPAGSGNDFARALGLRNVKDSIAAWRSFRAEQPRGAANVHVIDLGTITPLENPGETELAAVSRNSVPGRKNYFCSVASIGLDSEVARRANNLPRWLRGNGGYALSLAPALFRFAALPMKIFAQERNEEWSLRSDQPTTLAAFANSGIYGGGMKIAPRAKLDDGQLDVCVIAGMDPFKLACLFPTVYFGHHLDIRAVNYFQAARLRVETESPLDVYADGEWVCRTPMEVAVEAGALKVVV
ncbi:MAG TPA: diacylglycerol kinase family protein [Candidatus Dormibacteraeota bacterium]|nr:diacylglycerol kinase family protein [Candidatus Dormibacteraeota bacterium]